MKTNSPTSIILHSGKWFDYNEIENESIDIEDIAHGLSQTCRYGGQCQNFYSVAEHSFWVSVLVPSKYALEGLLHDSSESVLADIPAPFKSMLPEYKKIEYRLEKRLAEQYNIIFPFPQEIKEIDIRIRETELWKSFPKETLEGVIGKPSVGVNVGLCFWSPKEAKEIFLRRYRNIIKERSDILINELPSEDYSK